MDIKEISLKKRELESEIASLIADFGDETGVSIESVDVTIRECTTLGDFAMGKRSFIVERVSCRVGL